MKIYLFIFIVILLVACQQKRRGSIESIEVLYYNGIFDRIKAVDCDEIVYRLDNDTLDIFLEDGTMVPRQAVILKTSITDKEVLQEILFELNQSKIMTDELEDVRMKCYFFYEDGQKDSLCVGSISSFGIYNSQPVKLTNKFVYLIRENCGFYRWIDIDYMKYFNELNDFSFEREKVQSLYGEKY